MKAELTLKTAKEMYKQGGAAKIFALDNYTEEELNYKGLPSSWGELGSIKGYYIDDDSEINQTHGHEGTFDSHKNIFPTKELAEASLALAQLLQLRERYNDGWVANWKEDTRKYIIEVYNDKINEYSYQNTSKPLNFKTAELRDLFLQNFRDLIEIAKPLL